MSKLSRKEKKAQKQAIKDQKRAELEAKINNASPKAKAVGFGIIVLMVLGIYSCNTIEPSEEAVAKRIAEQQRKAQIEANKPKELGILRTEAIRACSDVIRSQTKEALKVEIHYITGSMFGKNDMGMAQTAIEFDVTNAFGQAMPYVARCYFDADKSLRTFDIEKGRL